MADKIVINELVFRKLNEQQLNHIYNIRNSFIYSHYKKILTHSQKRFSNRVIKSILNNEGKTIAACFSRQSGKTEALVLTVLFLAMFYGSIVKLFNLPNTGFLNIGIFAPQYGQSKTDFDRIKTYLKVLENGGYGFSPEEFNGNTIKLEMKNKIPVEIYCFSASPTSHTESKTINLIILEEAQNLLDVVIDNTISPMGVHTKATKLYIGTAGYVRCRFKELLSSLADEDKVIVPVDIVLKERQELFKLTNNPVYLNYKDSVMKEMRELQQGEDSDAYRVQYKLEWILEKGQFITYENLMKLEIDIDFKQMKDFSSKILYAGIDWGKQYDSTILTIVEANGRVIFWLEISGTDYVSQIKEICRVFSSVFGFNIKRVYCDSTGNQDMGVDMLKKELSNTKIEVVAVPMTAQKKDFMYKSLWSLMHPVILDEKMVEDSIIRFPKAYSREKEKFIKQFIDLQKDIQRDMWHCHHPEGNGYHDDYTDSLALACLGLSKTIEPNKHHSFSMY